MKNKGEDKIEHATKYEEKTGGGGISCQIFKDFVNASII
jgi:hypothetical protein